MSVSSIFSTVISGIKTVTTVPTIVTLKIFDKIKRTVYTIPRGNKIDTKDLQPGDVLLVNVEDGFFSWSNVTREFICAGQAVNPHLTKGHSTTVHAAIYAGSSREKRDRYAEVGDRCIAEAVGEGLKIETFPLKNEHDTYFVFRSKSPQIAQKAAEIAKDCVLKRGQLPGYGDYTKWGAICSITSYAPLSSGDFLKKAESLSKNYPKEFFCSGFVVFCYTLAALNFKESADKFILLDHESTTPMQLEHYLRTHENNWTFVGRVET